MDLEYTLTDSVSEALLLEANLIKRYRPRFNVRLKDDKSYPYIKITLADDFPRVERTRKLPNDGSRYFGPYASASSVDEAMNLVRRLFPFRTCTIDIRDGAWKSSEGFLDLDQKVAGDGASTATFERHFGPRYYSWNRGEFQYVVLDDVFWHGTGYIGYVSEDQLQWLAADLARVEKGSPSDAAGIRPGAARSGGAAPRQGRRSLRQPGLSCRCRADRGCRFRFWLATDAPRPAR